MIEVVTINELYSMIEQNPLNTKVELAEVFKDRDEYIFVDYLGDTTIDSDDTAMFFNKVQIQVYATRFDRFITLTNFIKHLFDKRFDKTKDDDYWVGTFVVDVRVAEWI